MQIFKNCCVIKVDGEYLRFDLPEISQEDREALKAWVEALRRRNALRRAQGTKKEVV